MKKTVIKIVVFILTFLIALIAIGAIMNRGNENMTVEMASASLPVITMEKEGISYNELHGCREPMDAAYQRETITELGENRDFSFVIDTYGAGIFGINVEVRSADGSRLIENSPVTDINLSENRIRANMALKDLIERDTEYSLTILLDIGGREPIRYYTRAVWSTDTKAAEKLAFVLDFHETIFSRQKAQEKGIAAYLESNASGDNSTFHKVNIHSSFYQITWGDLGAAEVLAPVVYITELEKQTGAFVVDFIVAAGTGEDTVYYMAEEFYRVRRVEGASRLYLLDYERTMTQIPDLHGTICANDKILLGIADENLPFMESADGNTVLFEMAGRLISYNATNNRMTLLFSFYDENNRDSRALYPRHNIKILNVDEGGSARFAVYGYMNRGRHEGQTGILIYSYDSVLNVVEEEIFIPYHKSQSVLKEEMEQLLYLNRDNQLYLFLGNTVYCVDIVDHSCQELVTVIQDGSLQVSESHEILVWQEGNDIYHSSRLKILDLGLGCEYEVRAEEGEFVMPLGFMNEDIIYGLARGEDIVTDSAGRVFFPMYKVCICSREGKLLKESRQEGYYVTGCSVEENQIILERMQRSEKGAYREADAEYIMSNEETKSGRNQLSVAVTDVYEKYVQIQTRNEIDGRNLQILTPKELVFEGDRNLTLEKEGADSRYYVYAKGEIRGIFLEPAEAVLQAYAESGQVTDGMGRLIWVKSNRSVRNQIMAITADAADEERSSLAVCLDAVLKYEKMDRSSQALLEEGYDALEILEDSLDGAQVLDLGGCTLDALLYYVNRDIPVLAVLEGGETVLITGFNQYNIVIMDPESGRLYQKGMNDSSRWLAENGNHFITYIR